jgi:sporulation integral membrane protein YlbJ
MKYIVLMSLIITAIYFFIYKNKKNTEAVIIIMLALLIVIYPDVSLNCAKEGINLWLFVIFPSLFPFFVINDMMISLGIPENISNLFKNAAKKLFNTSGYGAYVFFMSIFSGYPQGAKIVRDLIKNNSINADEGQDILNFCSTSGPLFIIGAVGTGLLKSPNAGYILYFAHITGAVLNGILSGIISKLKHKKTAINNKVSSMKTSINIYKSFASSLVTSGIIGSYIILFSVILGILKKIELFSLIESFLTKILPLSFSKFLSILIESSLEISNGSKIIASSGLLMNEKLIILSFIIAFSGISILGQVFGIITGMNLNFKKYIAYKISHGILSSVSCIMLLKLNIFSQETYSYNGIYFNINEFVLLIMLLMIIMLFNFISVIYKKY